MTATAVLWGPEHLHHGRTGTATLGGQVALALDRGPRPKAYPHTDPNEDVVAAVVDGDRVLLVVADGHHGQEASVAAVEAVLAWAQAGLPPELPSADAAVLVHEVGRHVHAVTRAADCANAESGTTLVLALVAGGTCWWASMGDSALYVGTPDGVRRLGKDRHRFLGRPLGHRAVRFALQCGARPLGAGESVVVCSDGLHEFAHGRAARDAVAGALAEQGPLATAVDIVRAAGEAGAGDNVAVAVWRSASSVAVGDLA